MSLNPSICNLTVSEYLQNWLEQVVRDNVKRGTFISYANTVKKRIIPYLGQKLLTGLRPKDIDNWVRSLASAGFAHNTLVQTKAVLSTALKYAIYPAELIPSNPCAAIAIPRNAPRHVIKRTIVTENLREEIKNHYPIGHKYRLPLLLAYHTGMRISEILGLDWQTVDVPAGRLTVKKQLLWDGITGGYYFDTPKSEAGCRTILLDSKILYEIQAWQRIQKELQEGCAENWQSADLICTDYHGHPLRYASLERSLQKRFGLNTHSFRHTHATKLIEGGASPIDVAARLGHSSAELVNNVYTHDTENMQRTTLAIWNMVLGNGHVIGNNISNVNTTGFKSSRVTFADTLNQNLSGATAPKDAIGGTNPKQIGLGSGIATVDLLFTDGTVQSTGKNTDLSLSGNGLFVVKNGNQTYYTRNGAFEFDASGNYVMPGSGMLVGGWMAQDDGTLVTNGEPGTINVPAGKTMDASATTTVTYANNLNSAMPTIVSAEGGTELKDTFSTTGDKVTAGTEYNPVYLTLSDGSTVTGSEYNAAWSYGYTITTAGEGATASSNNVLTLTLAGGGTATGISGTTYTVGGYYNSPAVSTTGAQVTASATHPVTLTMSDGSTHTATTGTFTVGSSAITLDSYDIDGNLIEGYVTSYSVSSEITQIAVSNPGGGVGTTFRVGGTASHTLSATGDEATASSSIPVTVRMSNGYSFAGVNGTTYTVGDIITAPTVTSGSIDITYANASDVSFKLANGHTVNLPVGTHAIGDAYTYTQSPYTWTASTANPITLSIGGNSYHSTTNVFNSLDSVYDLTGGDSPFVANAASAGDTSITVTGNSGNTYTFDIDESGGLAADIAAGTEISVNGGSWTGTSVTSSIESYTVSGTISSLTETYGITSIEGVKGYVATSTAPVTLTMSDGSTVKETTGRYLLGTGLPVTTTATVYDTLGNAFSVPIYFTKTNISSVNGNTWTVSVALDGTGQNTLTGTDGSTTTISMADTELHFDTDGHYTSGDGTVTFKMTNGSGETQNVQVNLSTLTQFAGSNTVNGTTDGYAAGTLESVSIDSAGIITGTYTNGERRYEAQVAVAQFTNASGLTKTGDSLYQSSSNSGTPNVKTASDLGVKITPSSLEMSNVDIANEFADMIVTQRGFQSNSKMITVGDEMLETVINMKR